MKARRSDDVRALARGATLLLAAAVAQRLLEWLFATRPMAAVVIGAFGLDLWGQRLGVRWKAAPPAGARMEADGTDPTQRFVARTGLAGFALGLAMGLTVVLLGVLAGVARMEIGWAALASVGFGTLRVLVFSFRDELFFRGVPLALVRDRVRPAWGIAFSAALGIAPVVLSSGSRPEMLLLGASASTLLALTWSSGWGGSAAWGIHAGWLFAVQVAARGAPFDVTWSKGTLASTAEAAGWPAYAGAAVFAATAFTLYGRKRAAAR